MKKIYLLLSVMSVFQVVNSQVINFPDPNFKAKLLTSVLANFESIDSNNDGEIEVSEALMVQGLVLNNSNISSISGIENFTNLKYLDCAYNPITSMDLSALPQLRRLNIYYNQLTSLNITGLSQIEWCNCGNNQLTSLDLTGVTGMYQLQCQNNQLTSLNISNAANIASIECQNNLLTSLDVNNLDHIYTLNCANNNLIQLNLKNNLAEYNLNFSGNPNLQYICADDSQLLEIQTKISQYGYNNCFTNTQCSFVPGNPVYYIGGTSKYDESNDGCDNADINYPNLKLVLSDGSINANVYSNSNGEFATGTQLSTISVTPELENPAYFNVSPSSQTLTFAGTTSPLIQNFCITPNGSHPDLEISFERTNQGFSAEQYEYIMTYRNKGTHTQSGEINLSYDDIQQNFSTSSQTVSSSSTGHLAWSFSDLKPFETRVINITFYINHTGDLGSIVNDGDNLNYLGAISSALTDETPNNNAIILNERYSSVILLNNPSFTFKDYFVLYPNPVESALNIKTKNNVAIENVIVYNVLGQSVVQLKQVQDSPTIDVSNLKTGSYIIKIFSDKGIFNSRFIKK